MFGVNMESKPNETPCESTRDTSEANNDVFFNNAESTLKKRKMDKGRVKCPRLSSFNISALRLSSSTSETSKVGNEGSSFNIDEELETLRCSPMIKSESPVFERKTSLCYSYNLTPRKAFNIKSKSRGSTSSDNDGVQFPLLINDDSNMSPKEVSSNLDLVMQDPIQMEAETVCLPHGLCPTEVSDNLDIVMQDPIQMKTETVCTPHGLICPPAQCPQRPSKIRKSDATYGAERSCRLLFTKSEDAMKDTVASYGCDGNQSVHSPPQIQIEVHCRAAFRHLQLFPLQPCFQPQRMSSRQACVASGRVVKHNSQTPPRTLFQPHSRGVEALEPHSCAQQ